MNKFRVTMKCRPVGAIGILFEDVSVVVSADDEDSARLAAIDAAHRTYPGREHFTPSYIAKIGGAV